MPVHLVPQIGQRVRWEGSDKVGTVCGSTPIRRRDPQGIMGQYTMVLVELDEEHRFWDEDHTVFTSVLVVYLPSVEVID